MHRILIIMAVKWALIFGIAHVARKAAKNAG